jgi:outer membrane receptor protein involved in Fe transport
VLAAGVALTALAAANEARATSAPALSVAGVEVVATPLAAGAFDAQRFPGPLQTADAEAIARTSALDLSAYLSRALGGVYVNDVQNNPLQPDVNYRGFTASPLLGTAQGLSVYLDGVRLNQSFGDVVSWDLIPRAAIRDLALVPGSNPLFGLNTLGGALAIRTKDGRVAPGAALQAAGGSWGRWQLEGETGGSNDAGFDWYMTANRFREDGWRDSSPSEATQAFGKLGWRGTNTLVSISGAYAYTDLTGNGLQEGRLLEADYDSIYTKPDKTQNQSYLFSGRLEHSFSDKVAFTGVAYRREIKTRTFNGDLNDDALAETVYQPNAAERAVLAAAGYTGVPVAGETAANTPFPSWRCIANALLNAEPGEKCNGLLNRSRTNQRSRGLSGQFSVDGALGGLAHRLIVGGGYDDHKAHFVQSAQYGYLTPDRGVVGVSGPGAFADGTQGSEDPEDARVDLGGRTRTISLFAADTLELTPALSVTGALRYDRTKVRNRDALIPGGGPGSLDGDHVFERANPAVSLSWRPSQALTGYAGYAVGSRAPSAIELGCADPENPCKLPNAMAGDPPLDAVVTGTWEAGFRGALAGAWTWRAGVYRAVSRDDILFVADDQSGFGYFRNFGKTRRQGIELGLDGRIGAVTVGARYDFLDATYRTNEVVNGEANSSNDGPAPGFEGAIDIEPGDRIPLVPRHLFKANIGWQATRALQFNADMTAVGGVYARGNENNEHDPDGVYYLGEGKTDAYAVFNLGAAWTPTPGLRLFAQVNNVFDKQYANSAQLGATGFAAGGAFVARPFAGPVIDGERPLVHSTFYAPGAPRMVWAGIRYAFGS